MSSRRLSPGSGDAGWGEQQASRQSLPPFTAHCPNITAVGSWEKTACWKPQGNRWQVTKHYQINNSCMFVIIFTASWKLEWVVQQDKQQTQWQEQTTSLVLKHLPKASCPAVLGDKPATVNLPGNTLHSSSIGLHLRHHVDSARCLATKG